MKKILALTTINNTSALRDAIVSIKKEYGDIVRLVKIYLDDYEVSDVPLEPIIEEINSSDIILVDIRGDCRVGRELPAMLNGKDKTVIVLIGGSQGILKLTKMGSFRGDMIFKSDKDREFNVDTYIKAKKFSELTKKLGKIIPFGRMKDMKNWVIAQEYYSEGDSKNIKNLLLFLLKNYAGVKQIKKVASPVHKPDYGLYIPYRGTYQSLEEYYKKINYDRKKPTVGVLLYGGMHFADTSPLADSIYDYLKEDVNFIFLFSKAEYNITAINKYFKDISLFLNLQYFRIHGGPYGGSPEPTYQFFKKTGSPMIAPLRAFSTEINSWHESKTGINPIEIILGVTLPELDGGIEPIFVAGMESSNDAILGKVKQIKVLDERIYKLCGRIKKWLALREKANHEKRLAIITYNYPPGEENLASAGYLDVFESLNIFLQGLKDSGYNIEIPEGSLKDFFLSNGLVNSPNYIQKSGIKIPAKKYFTWFKTLSDSIQKRVIDHWGEPPGSIMTDGDEIIIPGVLLGNIFMGVQPSRGVHENDDKAYHDKDLPPHHQYLAFYLFLERHFEADAVVHFGTHGTLEFTKGKEIALSSECFPDILIGNMPHIYYYWIGNTSESTIAKRRAYAICLSHASPPMKSSGLYEKYIILEDLLTQYESDSNESILELIKETAQELHMPLEIHSLRKELYKMKRRLIPYGLHIMDKTPVKEEMIDYLMGVLRIDRDLPSILKLLSDEKGLKWDEIKDTNLGNDIEMQAREIIQKILDGEPVNGLYDSYRDYVTGIVERLKSSREREGLLEALNGRYILPSRGGDPIRDPDVYPSGRAMYAFDPRLIPTITAELRGRRAAEVLIESYLKKHGRYPESVGIVLWGFETMKTGGDTIATILGLLGVRIKHKKNPWVKELEVIPSEELKRPRVDVLITICGIFRDTLGTHIELLNRAIEMTATVDEPLDKNFIRKHYLMMKQELNDFALARIFGPSPTEYATSMRTLIETSAWKDEGDLVRSYEDSMSYAYLKSDIKKNEKAFGSILKTVDIVTQERDNTEYEVTDLDHYYEFLGGLSRTVQDKKGEQAEIMVVDSTEEDVSVEDLKVVIERATRTRTLNPLWIDGMLKHDFAGAQKIKDRVEYLMAFAATTGKVDNWLFDEVAERLIFNEEMRERLQQNNPYAAMKIGELLIESERRGYWKAEREKIKELQNIILKIEGDIE